MLHQKLEPVTKTFSAATRRMLNRYADELSRAKDYADMADRMKGEVRGALVDLFGAVAEPGSAAYHVDGGPLEGSILCLDLAVRYEGDMARLAQVLGDRLQHVTVTEPVFNRDKAEAAIKAGIVSKEEMAKCATPVPRPSALVRTAADGRAPKGIEAGKARMTPLKLPKGVKLDWG